MTPQGFNERKHCRWCGQVYYAYKPYHQDGFDKPRCKQAHYRAYKKYVTATDGPGPSNAGQARTSK